MVVCLERGADLHMAQRMPLPLTVSCFSKILLVLPFWYRLTRVVPYKGLLNGSLCVVCVFCVFLRFNALQSPMHGRRERLEDSLRWHQLQFDADSELQWIKEHRPAAASTDYGKTLNNAQNLHAKQKVGRQQHSAPVGFWFIIVQCFDAVA